jgi:Type II secretion system (T2SS), protein K
MTAGNEYERSAGPHPRATGFVLPVTAILLALISVGVALMAHRSDQLRTLVIASQQEQQATKLVQRHVATSTFLSSTLPRFKGRLGDIELDGRFYLASDGTFLSYQDAAGLFNLRWATADELVRLLRAVGVAENLVLPLAEKLLDYTDADDLVRANGAEAAEYKAAKLPPPRNAPLLTAHELQRVLGWRDLDAVTKAAILENTYIAPTSTLNRYTATAPALAAISGLNLEAAKALLAQRGPGMPLEIESLPALVFGNFLSASRYSMLSSPTLHIKICPAQTAWCQHLSITNTPNASEGPWHVDYSVRQMRAGPLPPVAAIPPLPEQPPTQPTLPVITPFGIGQ